jgi:TfoX/Sxy family transcriptional regulator of competence genes
MAYDSKLAARIRAIVGRRKGVSEKEMFGGIAFLLDGKMFIGLANNQLMVRVGPDRHDEALARPHVRPMDFTGRPMRGYVYVAPAGYANARALSAWIDWSTAFVATVKKTPRQPPKPRKPKTRSPAA